MVAKIRVVWGGHEAYCEGEEDDGLVHFDSWDEIPGSFTSETEEHAWWDTHRPSARLLWDTIDRERERRAHGEPEPPELARIPRRPEPPRIYPPEDEGKRIVEPDEVPTFASDAEHAAYWAAHTLSRTVPAQPDA